MEYRALLSPFYVRIRRLENWMQEIAVNDIIYPQKSLSLSPIGQNHA
jgi:hypothetical protein